MGTSRAKCICLTIARSTAVIRNQTLAQWFASNLIVSPTGLLHPSIHGFFIDDVWRQHSARDLNGSEASDMRLFDRTIC